MWYEIDDEGGLGACAVWGFHSGLLVMLLASSVMISVMMYHSARLKEPPNIRFKYYWEVDLITSLLHL